MSLKRRTMVVTSLWGVVCLVGLASAAGPVYWDWPADRSFGDLELSGTAIDADGHLVAGLVAHAVGPTGPEMFWRAVADGRGGYYAGSGHGGEVFHAPAGGEPELLVRVDAAEVLSLLLLDEDDLLVGCGPTGQVYRISGDGRHRLVGTVTGGYVWSMTRDPQSGTVWLATGTPGAVYRFDPDTDELTEQWTLPVDNVTSVLATGDGELTLATQGPGLVYRWGKNSGLRLHCEVPQSEARSLIRGPEGEIYLLALQARTPGNSALAGRSDGPQSGVESELMSVLGASESSSIAPAALYHIVGRGAAVEVWSGKQALLTATWSPRWGWLGGGEVPDTEARTTLWSLLPPGGAVPLARWSGGDILDILVASVDAGDLIVSQAHTGAIHALTAGGRSPHLALSQPLDGGQPVRWGRLRWTAEGRDADLEWSVRGGNRAQPDETWTAWSKPWSDRDRQLALPHSRYLQWRVKMPSKTDGADALRITGVSVSAWEDNLPPVITAFQWEQLRDISLGGMLNGSDTVTQRFRSGLQAEFSWNAVDDKWADPDRGALGRSVQVFTWQASDPNDDRLIYRLEYRLRGEAAWRALSGSRPGVFETRETLASWDTAEVPDGVYELRVVASDRLDNPAGLAGEASREMGPLVVDNTPPTVTDLAVKPEPAGFSLRFGAADETNVLAGARLRLPDGAYERLDPEDLICDSRREEFSVQIAWPREGSTPSDKPWLIRLEVRDLAGNLATVAGEVH